MTDSLWRTSVGQWGDQLWALALIGTGDRAAAQHALVQAFERVYTAKTPLTDTRTALIQALVPRRRHWLPRFSRQRAVPRVLRRVDAADRVVLALWLAHEHDGAQLARVTQLSQSTLVPRLVAVLVPFLPRSDPARRTAAGRAAFAQWVEHQLGINAAPLPDTLAEGTITGWQQVVDRVRDLLAAVTKQQRLPASCRDAIETAMTVQVDEMPAWQRSAGWIALALLVLAIGWIVRPTLGTNSAATSAVPQRADARSVVQAAIDGWTTMPVSGTLHRRVWAIDARPGSRNPALVTDVWLPSDGEQYRVETTHDGKSDEWHVVDSRGQLHIASELLYNMCQWSYGASVPMERRAQIFTIPSAQVRAVRAERLRSGTYGEGYRMLRRALHAPDLHSYGVRTDNERVLLTLGFRDGETTPARTILLVIDARTNELQAVRELAGDAAHTTARDLWRLDAHETVPTVPTSLPRWDGQPRTSDEIIDPACPSLAPNNVISMRRMAAMSSGPYSGPYGVTYVPTPLPSNVTHAAFITFAPVGQNGFLDPSGTQVVLRSADGWLRIRNTQNMQPPIGAADDVRRGAWTVRFKAGSESFAPLSATVWHELDDASPDMMYVPVFNVEALGWTREQFLETIERLQLLTEQAWPTLAAQFLDPHPLPTEVEQALLGAQQAINPPRSGALHVVIETTAYQGQEVQPVRDDPYHIPQSSVSQERLRIAQWAVLSDTALLRSKQLITQPDGTLFSGKVASGHDFATYYAGQAVAYRGRYEAGDEAAFNPGMNDGLRLDVARSLFAVDAPITMTAQGESWRFEQALPGDAYSGVGYGWEFSPLRDIPYIGGRWISDPQNGTLVQRVWLDRQSNLPRRWELVQRGATGAETIVRSLAVHEWSVLPSAPDDAFWTLPPLPPETLLVEGDIQTGTVTKLATVDGPLALSPPKRALVWHLNSGLNITRDEPYSGTPRVATIGGYSNTNPLGALLSASINDLSNTGWVRFTTYTVPDTTLTVQVTQGPRALLRHVLRQPRYDQPLQGTTFPESQPIEVTIAGAQQHAWILRNSSGGSALVVELDDVLLHIKANDAYLTGVLLEQLPALQWEDVILTSSGGAIAKQP